MSRQELWSLTAALSLCLAARAGGTPADDPRRIAPPKRIPDSVEQPLAPAGKAVSTASMPREVRRAVVSDAAKRFQVPENAVVIAQAERVIWSDGSLGCAEPGMAYTQALVPGYRVTARTTAGQFVYHTDERGNFVSCGTLPRQRARPAESKGAGDQPPTQPPGGSPDH
jgi:hypothetical protein